MATTQWIGMSGDWSIPFDWSADTVPGPSDEAVIAAAGNYTVTVTSPETVGSVSLDDPGAILDIQAGISQSGTLTVNGSLDVQSGTLKIDGSGYLLSLGLGAALAIGDSLNVQSGGTLFLDGGTIEGGSLTVGQGGVLEVSQFDGLPLDGSALQSVTVLGGLTLNSGALVLSGNTTVENSDGTGPGAITLNGNSTYLTFAENYTLHNLNLNGGSVAGDGTTVTVEKDGLVQGYGEFIFGPFSSLALDNDGTIHSNVNGQSISIVEMPFVNDGLVLASGGGNISINWNDPFDDAWSNNADGTISVIDGGTLQVGGRVTNSGVISAVDSTLYFGDDNGALGGPGLLAQNAGDIVVFGGKLFLDSPGSNQEWADSGLIATVDAATDVLGYGVISAGGTLSVLGGSVSGPASLQDDGQIKLGGASMDLSSLTIGASGELSGFGTVASPIVNSGTIDAVAKLDLSGAVTGDGHLQISNFATLELGGPTAEGVTFEANFGQLYLDKAANFSGTIAGMTKGVSVDLADFSFSSHPVITNVAGTGAAGSTTDVTITDGTLTTTLQLLNDYAGQYPVTAQAYHLTSDHSGSAAGTLFTLANPHGQDNFAFAPNLGQNVDASSIVHQDVSSVVHQGVVASPTSALTDFSAGLHMTAHDTTDAAHFAALTAPHAHDFII
jgi:hypothetical protein